MEPQLTDSVREQLLLLRGMTKTTGILHEAQVLQLKYWPLVVTPHATSAEFGFSWEKREVDFLLKVKGKDPEDLEERFQTLDQWVKFLLGDDYLVRVKIRNKTIYRGMRKSQPPPKPNPQYDTQKFEKKVRDSNFNREFEKRKRQRDE